MLSVCDSQKNLRSTVPDYHQNPILKYISALGSDCHGACIIYCTAV